MNDGAGGPITQALLQSPKLNPEMDRCNLFNMRARQKGKWNRELLNMIAQSRFVEVDIRSLKPQIQQHDSVFFDLALLQALFLSATGVKMSTVKELPDDIVDGWNKGLVSAGKQPHKGMWFVFIDEIGILEDKAFQQLFIFPKEKPHDALFLVVSQLILSHPKIITFCAGRSSVLSVRSFSSPVNLSMLVLSPFEPEQIAEIISETKMVNAEQRPVTIREFLGTTMKSKLDVLVQVIHEFTGGIPRLVQITLETLALQGSEKGTTVIEGSEKLEELMKGPVQLRCRSVMNHIFKPPKDPNLRFKCTQLIFIRLPHSLFFFSHHHHYQIDLSRMTISPMDREFLDDLTNLAVYLKPAEGGNLRVVISRFLVDVINEAGLGISPLAGLLRESCHLPPGILSQGNTLMLLIAERLSMHLLKSKKLSEIPGLQYSKFSNTPLCKDQGEHFQVRHIPSFCVCVSTSCGKPAKRKINETEVISSFNPSDWNLFIDSPAVPQNAVGISI